MQFPGHRISQKGNKQYRTMKSMFWAILTFWSPILMTAIPGEHFFTSSKQSIEDKRSKLPFFGVDIEEILSIILSWKLMLLLFLGNDFQGLVCNVPSLWSIPTGAPESSLPLWSYTPLGATWKQVIKAIAKTFRSLRMSLARGKWWALPLIPWIVRGALGRKFLWKVQECVLT